MKIFGRNSGVSINGKSYVGNNITITNNQVIIDGVIQDGELNNKGKINVVINCNVDKIVSDESINIVGNVSGNIEAKVNVSCFGVNGDVNAGVNVNCDDIKGDAKAGVTINCDDIRGNATAVKINR